MAAKFQVNAAAKTLVLKTTKENNEFILHVKVDSSPENALAVEGPLTDDELRATPVPVSGPLTDGELRATPVPIEIPAELIDSFSRLRTSDPAYRFDSQFTYRIDDDLWDTKTTGTATITHDATNRMSVLSASNTAGTNEAILQSHYHPPYTSGRGTFALVTFRFRETVEAGGEREAGLTDGSNGIYLLQNSDGIHIGLRTTTEATSELKTQGQWNYDNFDGQGPSGLTLNLDKTQIFGIPLQALYVGLVITGFDINGRFYPAHLFAHANLFDRPYIAQASLPVRYRAKSVNTAAAVVLDAICSTVISEGGADLQDIPGRTFVASNKLTFRTLNSVTKYPLLAIECVQQLNSINQNAVVLPLDVEVTMASNPGWVDIILRPATLTKAAGAPTWIGPETGSTVRYSVDADALTGGTVVGGAYISATAGSRTSKSIGILEKVVMAYSHLLGKGDQLVIAVTTSGNATGGATVGWKEIR